MNATPRSSSDTGAEADREQLSALLPSRLRTVFNAGKDRKKEGEGVERIIFHIDVNSAYLSWTSVENLKCGGRDLRNIPAIIGGDQEKRRGVVLAKSIPAKAFGVRTGEPVAHALRKCPHLVMEKPNHRLYGEYSERLMEFLLDFTSKLEQVSVDECFMDCTDVAASYSSPVDAAVMIKDQIREKFGFTVNIGISSNKLLAKMASDFKKPDLVHTLFPEEIREKMWPLPVGELYMAGSSSVEKLHMMEIETIGDLAQADVLLLEAHMKSHGRLLWEYANGLDDSPVNYMPAKAKGIGNSTTLAKDLETRAEAEPVLKELSDKVGQRLRNARQLAGMVSVEIKYYDFRTASHQMQLDRPSAQGNIILSAALRLFDELWSGEPVRLLGVRTSKLCDEDEPMQMSIFDTDWEMDEKHRKLNHALDQIRQKFGDGAVVRGSLPDPERKQ